MSLEREVEAVKAAFIPGHEEEEEERGSSGRLHRELRACWHAFFKNDNNSNTEKWALRAAIVLWFLGGVGILFGLVPLDSTPARELWATLAGVMILLFGRLQGKESERLKDEE